MSEPWILHDPNVPDLPFEDLDRCLEQAALAIRVYFDEDGWTEGVDEIYISRAGMVTHRATKTVIDRPGEIAEGIADNDADYIPVFDEYWSFYMAEVEPVLE
jgi:hypothetical protein